MKEVKASISIPNGAGPAAGSKLGGYTVVREIGSGAMGAVYRAEDDGGHPVALKMLHRHLDDPAARERLRREAAALQGLRHPAVARVLDAELEGPEAFIVTELVEGPTLEEEIDERGPLDSRDLFELADQLADALEAVHGTGVVHRDLTPSNVLIARSGPVLIDFGLARVSDDPRLTRTGWLLGTPGYLAPEILHGDDATTASDVHSWAATVAFAGTGHPPFGRGPSMAIMDRVRRGEHDLEGLPDDLRALVSAALRPDPARRPGLAEIVGRLGGNATALQSPEGVEHDPFTLPLALAAHDRRDEVTPTRAFLAGSPGSDDPDDLPLDLEPVPERESATLVLRRGVAVLVLGLLLGAVTAEWPYGGLLMVLGASWLLRTCTLIVTAHGDRRRLRGARWYDVLVGPLSAPWYLVAAMPGALLLGVWALGLGLAAILLCYAAGASTAATLFTSGICIVVGLWVGPGASHVRWPVRVLAHAVARRTGRWAVITALLVAVTGFVGHQASLDVDWSPFGRPPLVGR
jgi:predicted Ser/Thr protein kinase